MITQDEKHIIKLILSDWGAIQNDKSAFVGLDGYVDKIQHPVQYQQVDQSIYYSTLDSFGQRIKEAAGVSAQIELFTQLIKAGGNAPIMANALATLGILNTCIGTMGYPHIHPIFDSIHPNCKLQSIGKAAETNALEFGDGKLILSELSVFSDLNWEKVKSLIKIETLIKEVEKVDLIAMVGWSNLPFATNIWEGFFKEIVRPHISHSPHFLFDLADPSKKSNLEIAKFFQLIHLYKDYGTVTLGLNENEANKLYQAIAQIEQLEVSSSSNLESIGSFIFQHSGAHNLMIHPIDGCYLWNATDIYFQKGRVIRKPKVSTGGGDNFNAGFYFGLLNGYSLEASMVLAMATSGAYVQNGKSPGKKELKKYLNDWQLEVD